MTSIREDRPASRAAGFTIIELMVLLSVVGILAAIAVPNMRTFIQNGRLTSAANDLLRSLQLARTEAIKRQRNVVVCASADPTAATPTCSYGPFRGWIVFQDSNADWQWGAGEAILERHALVDSSVTVKTDNDGIEAYAGTGFAIPAGTGTKRPTNNILICDVRGNQIVGTSSVERAVLVYNTGRARVSTASADVTAAAGAAGACP